MVFAPLLLPLLFGHGGAKLQYSSLEVMVDEGPMGLGSPTMTLSEPYWAKPGQDN